MLRAFLAQAVLVILLAAPSAFSAEKELPAEMEKRAKVLFLQLRCVVCQNQSIGDSDADVARDLREIVREQIVAGKTNGEIKQFLVDRYGEFILLRPVFALHTLLLWGAPVLLLVLGGWLSWRLLQRQSKKSETTALTGEEEDDLRKLIDQQQ